MTALLVLFALLGLAIVALGTWLAIDAHKRGRVSGRVRSPEELYQARAADTEQHRARFGGGGMDQQNWPG